MTTTPSSSAPADVEAQGVLCPGCGYDLRGMTGERCSECGLVVDPASLQRSSIPWAHREAVGRVRAFLKTIWLITNDSKSIRHEAARPQSAAEAELFRRWVAALLAVTFSGVALAFQLGGSIQDNVIQKPPVGSFVGQMPPWMLDLAVPWSAGIALWPALYLYAVMAAAIVAGAARGVFRTRGMPSRQAEAARALAGYAAAPLVWLLPGVASVALFFWIAVIPEKQPFMPAVAVAGVSFYLFLFMGVVLPVLRTGQWRARVTHGGWATGLLAMAELILRWVLGVGIILSVVPWCVGFIWIVIDSFRG